MSLLQALAWVGTYAVHSTLLGLAAWLVARAARSARVREIAWRTALFGPLFTTGAQHMIGLEPSAGLWRLPALASEAALAEVAPPLGDVAPLHARGAAELAALDLGPIAAADDDPLALDWVGWALRGWLLVVLGSLLWTAAALGTWRRRLAGRRPLESGPVVDHLARLEARAGRRRPVRLSVCEALDAPIAVGVLRPEICLPPRALELAPELREAMLAHELAHLARRDPLWLALARGVETLFFFQPLHRLARRRLAQCAEFLCDDWALARTGDRLGLARCLTEVASWIVGRPEPVRACAMADRRSPLGQRVERILDEGRRPEGERAWLAPLGAAALSATVWVAPGFASPAAEPVPLPEPGREASATPASLPGWEGLAAELDALSSELEELSAEADARLVDAATRARLEAVGAWLSAAREKERRIRELYALWRAASADPEDER